MSDLCKYFVKSLRQKFCLNRTNYRTSQITKTVFYKFWGKKYDHLPSLKIHLEYPPKCWHFQGLWITLMSSCIWNSCKMLKNLQLESFFSVFSVLFLLSVRKFLIFETYQSILNVCFTCICFVDLVKISCELCRFISTYQNIYITVRLCISLTL